MIRTFKSLGALARHLEAVAAAMPEAEYRILRLAGATVQRIARDKLGHYQEGWPELASSTIADKERNGWPVPSPELRSGAMSDSITFEVGPRSVTIGSESPIAAWQEFGTSKMPARPFLGPAMIEAEPEIKAIAVGEVMRTFRER
ncbi:MAG TPA: HK97-gp10 family putative phage morphogenesis protein [Stellaceae bacterium]|nr:HK97-gp10 family putative phage morphogenesis protein [Stellaceae bacterium]